LHHLPLVFTVAPIALIVIDAVPVKPKSFIVLGQSSPCINPSITLHCVVKLVFIDIVPENSVAFTFSH
jgi:hypothetical protein